MGFEKFSYCTKNREMCFQTEVIDRFHIFLCASIYAAGHNNTVEKFCLFCITWKEHHMRRLGRGGLEEILQMTIRSQGMGPTNSQSAMGSSLWARTMF